MASIFDQYEMVDPGTLISKGFKVTEKDGFWWADVKFGNSYGEIISGNLNIPETPYPVLYFRKDKYTIESLTDLEILMDKLQ